MANPPNKFPTAPKKYYAGGQEVSKQDYKTISGKGGKVTPGYEKYQASMAQLSQQKQVATGLGLKAPGEMLTPDVNKQSIEALREHSTAVEDALMKLSAAQGTTEKPTTETPQGELPAGEQPPQEETFLKKTARFIAGRPKDLPENTLVGGSVPLGMAGFPTGAPSLTPKVVNTAKVAAKNSGNVLSLGEKLLGLSFVGDIASRTFGFGVKVFKDQVGDNMTEFQAVKTNIDAIRRNINMGGDPLDAIDDLLFEKENLIRIRANIEKLNAMDISSLNGADNAYAQVEGYIRRLRGLEERIKLSLLKSKPGQKANPYLMDGGENV